MLLISLTFFFNLILGQTSYSCYLCCANMVVILYLDVVVPVFLEDNDTRGDNP